LYEVGVIEPPIPCITAVREVVPAGAAIVAVEAAVMLFESGNSGNLAVTAYPLKVAILYISF
jgi:hypothetical protein